LQPFTYDAGTGVDLTSCVGGRSKSDFAFL
jgi:hypothetical protein